MNAAQNAERAVLRPRIDIHETADALVLVADLPGVREDALDLQLEDDVLTLKATTAAPDRSDWTPLRTEFRPADFERRLRIAAEIDREAIAAAFQNGQLRVTLPKRKPTTHRIEVRRT